MMICRVVHLFLATPPPSISMIEKENWNITTFTIHEKKNEELTLKALIVQCYGILGIAEE